jgi:hypothetical protein
MRNESAELEYLRMENSLLKERLMEVTKNPEYIRPPTWGWTANEPPIMDIGIKNIKVYELAHAAVEFHDYNHHVILRMLAQDKQELRYAYMISDVSLYHDVDRFGILDMLHRKALRAIAYHLIEKEYGETK